MKKTFSILLASLLLVFTLTACGGDQKGNGANTDGGNAVTNPSGGGSAGSNGANGDQDTGAADNGEPGAGSETDGLVPGDDAALGGETDGGTAAKQRTRVGASYDQMLRNGRVHDTDGKLWDHENAVTPDAAY